MVDPQEVNYNNISYRWRCPSENAERLIDAPNVRRLWKSKGFPEVELAKPEWECLSTYGGVVFTTLDINDPWRFRKFLAERVGAVHSVYKAGDGWHIYFYSSRVARAFLSWIYGNLQLFIQAAFSPRGADKLLLDSTLSNLRFEKERLDKTRDIFVVLMADEMVLGNFTARTWDKRGSRATYKLRPEAFIKSLASYFLNSTSLDSSRRPPSITVLVNLTRGFFYVFLQLLDRGVPTWFKIEASSAILRQGQALFSRKFVRDTKVDQTNFSLCLAVHAAPLVYRQTFSDETSACSQEPWSQTEPHQQWVRDFDREATLGWPRGGNTHWRDQHPLTSLSSSWVIVLTRKRLRTDVANRFQGHLRRASLLAKTSRIRLRWVPANSFKCYRGFAEFWNRLQMKRSPHVYKLLLSLISFGGICDPTVLLRPSFSSLLDTRRYSDDTLVAALKALLLDMYNVDCHFDTAQRYKDCLEEAMASAPAKTSSDRGNEVFHVYVTPFKIFLEGPHVAAPNRVLGVGVSKQCEFYRVHFREETFQDIHLNTDTSRYVGGRIDTVLRNGIRLMNESLTFLGYSSSQLRALSAWFICCDGTNTTPEKILRSMGDFMCIQETAKMTARQGQCFSSAQSVLELRDDEFVILEDVTCDMFLGHPELGQFTFTDGVGFCRPDLLMRIKEYLQLPMLPSAVQIRYKGCKGMLAVNPTWFDEDSPEHPRYKRKKLQVVFRKSMWKFNAKHTSMEIIGTSSCVPFHFNRQILLALDSLGVNWDIFLQMQADRVNLITQSTTNEGALLFLQPLASVHDSFALIERLLLCGISVNEPFIQDIVRIVAAYEARHLIHKSWIRCEDGCVLYGVSDDTQTLQYDHGEGLPEVFFRIRRLDASNQNEFALFDDDSDDCAPASTVYTHVGPVFIAKCPVLYPGDIQLCYAVDREELYHYENVLVFPQTFPTHCARNKLHPRHPNVHTRDDLTFKDMEHMSSYTGFRDIPNMLSGGDLDGDQYHICWEPRIIEYLMDLFERDRYPKPAGFYLRDETQKKRSHCYKELPLMERLKRFYMVYAMNDFVALIASAHERKAHEHVTYAKGKAFSRDCIELAQLHSCAVDFPKTGVPATMPGRLRPRGHPHFRKPTWESDRSPYIYHSVSLIGALYDSITSERQLQAYIGDNVIITGFYFDGYYTRDQLQCHDFSDEASLGEAVGYQVPGYYALRLHWELPTSLQRTSFLSFGIHECHYRDASCSRLLEHRTIYTGPDVRHVVLYVEDNNAWESSGRFLTYTVYIRRLMVDQAYRSLSTPVMCLAGGTGRIVATVTLPVNSGLALQLFLYNLGQEDLSRISTQVKDAILHWIDCDEADAVLSVTIEQRIPVLDLYSHCDDDRLLTSHIYEKYPFHFRIVISGDKMLLERLIYKLTGRPPCAAAESNTLFPERFGIVALRLGARWILSTHTLSARDFARASKVFRSHVVEVEGRRLADTKLPGSSLVDFCRHIHQRVISSVATRASGLPPLYVNVSCLRNASNGSGVATTRQVVILCCSREQREAVAHCVNAACEEQVNTSSWMLSIVSRRHELDDTLWFPHILLEDIRSEEPNASDMNTTSSVPDVCTDGFIVASNPLVLSAQVFSAAVVTIALFRQVICKVPLTRSFLDFCHATRSSNDHAFPHTASVNCTIVDAVKATVNHLTETYLRRRAKKLKNLLPSGYSASAHHVDSVIFNARVSRLISSTYTELLNGDGPSLVSGLYDHVFIEHHGAPYVSATVVTTSWLATSLLLDKMYLPYTTPLKTVGDFKTRPSSSPSGIKNVDSARVNPVGSRAVEGDSLSFSSCSTLSNTRSPSPIREKATAPLIFIAVSFGPTHSVRNQEILSRTEATVCQCSYNRTDTKADFPAGSVALDNSGGCQEGLAFEKNTTLEQNENDDGALAVKSNDKSIMLVQDAVEKEVVASAQDQGTEKQTATTITKCQLSATTTPSDSPRFSATVLEQFPVLRSRDPSCVDWDLVHPDFYKFTRAVKPHYKKFSDSVNDLLFEYKLYDEAELITGCILKDPGSRLGRQTKDKVTFSFKKLVESFQPNIGKLLLFQTSEQRKAVAAAAYVLCSQARDQRMEPKGSVVNANGILCDDQEDVDELSDRRDRDTSSNSSLSAADVRRRTGADRRRNSNLVPSDSFCWIFFGDYLIALKKEAQYRRQHDDRPDRVRGAPTLVTQEISTSASSV